MTILFCGGEEIDFTPKPLVHTGPVYSGRYRSSYARCCLYNNGTVYRNTTPFTEVQSVWVTFRCFQNTLGSGDYYMGGVADITNSKYIAMRRSNFNVDLIKYDGGWSSLDKASGTSIGTFKYDMHISNYGASATVRVYEDNALICEYIGDITLSGVTGFTYFVSWGTNGYCEISEIIVSTTDTRLMSLKTLAPNASGDTNDWTGDYDYIDEVEVSDADIIYTTDRGDDFQANLTGMPSGTWKVRGVRMVVSAADEAVTLGLKVGVKTNSVVHLGGAHNLGGAWATYDKYYETNPATSSAFTSGEIDALQLAIRADSTTTTTT